MRGIAVGTDRCVGTSGTAIRSLPSQHMSLGARLYVKYVGKNGRTNERQFKDSAVRRTAASARPLGCSPEITDESSRAPQTDHARGVRSARVDVMCRERDRDG